MIKFNQKHINVILFICLFVFLIILYSWFNWSVLRPLSHEFNYQYIFNWPDAMANNYFIDSFIETSKFVQPEPLNAILNDIIRPRSVNIVNHDIVPSGFLGILILYGWLGKIFTKYAVIYFTPIIASLGVFVFYFFVKELINKRAAMISSLLLATLAPYIFFANQTLLATVPFLVAVISGFYCLMKSGDYKDKKTNLLLVLAGFLLGLAITIRYQEAIWIIASLLMVLLSQLKQITIKKTSFFILGFIIPIAAVLFYNWQTYGELFTVGYLRMNNPADSIGYRLPAEISVSHDNNLLAYTKLLFLPFGFSARNIYHNFVQYVWMPYAPYLAFFMVGVVVWSTAIIKKSYKQKVYAACAGLASLILILYYGSWIFTDAMVLQNNIISSSYTRYWLPILIMTLPITGYLLDHVLKKATKLWSTRFFFVVITIILLLFISITKSFTAKGDGLLAQAEVTRQYYERAQAVTAIVEPDALIMVEREDKLFFPTHKVITFEQDYSIFSELKNIGVEVPIYYLSVSTDNDMDFINKNKLKVFRLSWELIQEIDKPFRLFKLKIHGD
ncbi:MAG: hypothetical protein UT91_C0011G0025 [Parcubacteria group bacterium GW2011_GWA2_40_23]|nr:MAG: hypothetical protein UT91_C0011G0025 [Parcubacteria group bacterium GW2011_GWA2_40_23]